MTKDKTAPERVARATKKKHDKGWVRVYAWAKSKKDRALVVMLANVLLKGSKQDKAALRAYAKKLRGRE